MVDLSEKLGMDVLLCKGKCFFGYGDGRWVEHTKEESELLSGIMYFSNSNINNEEFETSDEMERFCIVWVHRYMETHSYVGLKKEQARKMFEYFKREDAGEDKIYAFRLKDGVSFEDFCLVSRLTKN